MSPAIVSPQVATPLVDAPPLTAEEFARRPEPLDGSREELIRGKVVTMPPPSFEHGEIQLNVGTLLRQFAKERQLGRVVTESGLKTRQEPDSVRGPDISFWSRERIPLDAKFPGYPDVAADFCIEILSPDDRPKRLQQKISEYFSCGVRLVWVLDPEARNVTVYREPGQGRVLWEEALITGEDVLPGFECRVAELFDA